MCIVLGRRGTNGAITATLCVGGRTSLGRSICLALTQQRTNKQGWRRQTGYLYSRRTERKTKRKHNWQEPFALGGWGGWFFPGLLADAPTPTSRATPRPCAEAPARARKVARGAPGPGKRISDRRLLTTAALASLCGSCPTTLHS